MSPYRKNLMVGVVVLGGLVALGWMILQFGDAPIKFFSTEQIRVQFAREDGGERRVLSHGVKPLRGQLVNYVVRESVASLDGLRGWRAPEGYRLDEAATEHDAEARTTTVTFVRPD